MDWYIIEDDHRVPDQEYVDHFRPKYFQPHLRLIGFPEDCPESVTKPFEDSFALFFSAPSAASNSVRIALESLLTELKVKRFDIIGGKQRAIGLHRRITLLPAKYSHIKDMILAVKWLGNAGSHEGAAGVTLDDVMDSYELMEHILQEVFSPKVEKLKKIANKLTKKKGAEK